MAKIKNQVAEANGMAQPAASTAAEKGRNDGKIKGNGGEKERDTRGNDKTGQNRGGRRTRGANGNVNGNGNVKDNNKDVKDREQLQQQQNQKQNRRKSKEQSVADVQNAADIPVDVEPSGTGRKNEKKVRVIPLGGLGEIGKNMTVIEYGEDLIIVDCGLSFPEEDMYGVDLVIPDFAYLEANRDKVRGLFLTHGHEDHIGAVPYFLRSFNVPIYGTALTLGIIKNKLAEHHLNFTPQLNVVKAGDKVRRGVFEVEFIHVNHSIADACALAISTPCGVLVHSGDFKLDVSPIEGDMMDVARLGELGRRGVKLLMCESTNAERAGFTPSERTVGSTFENVFTANADKRIVVATFSSNVHRVQQIIDVSVRHGRHVAVTGRSMLNIVAAAIELGYMKPPAGTIIDVSEMKRYRPGELTLITTGSQGEPMSALYRMAFADHSQITLGPSDLVILSSSAIPGNEKFIGRIINALAHSGVKVIYDAIFFGVHTSGHACAEEIKLMQQLIRPRFYMPIHGEYRHLAANRDLALFMGIPAQNIFVGEVGRVLEIGRNSASFGAVVPSGKTLIDGLGIGDVGKAVLRDRKHLSEDGMLIVFASVDIAARLTLNPPEIISKGFVYMPDAEELINEAKRIASEEISVALDRGRGKADLEAIKERVRREVTKLLTARTGRNPMVIPLITDL